MDTEIRHYIDRVIKEHRHVSFDLDELYQDVKLWNKSNMFSIGLELFDNLIDELVKLDVKGVMVQVQFPLITLNQKK